MNKKRTGSIYELLNPENIDPVTKETSSHPCQVKIDSYSSPALPAASSTKKRKPYGLVIPGTVTLYNTQHASFFAKVSDLGPKKSAQFKNITHQTCTVNKLPTLMDNTASHSIFITYIKPG